jgi:hypothetical protein
VAFKEQGDRIKKSMVVAIACSADADEHTDGQPFWLA